MAYCKIRQFSIDNLHRWSRSTPCKNYHYLITMEYLEIFLGASPASEWVIYNLREHLNSGAYRLVVYGSLAGIS